MTPLLAPLVGDAPTITIIGLCKNAGKTTAMCRLIEELSGEVLAMTSVGRDGERTDVVTGTEKPEIWVPEGTLFATARGMLPLCDTTLQVEGVTDVMTPLGAVGIFRALSDGFIQLAGPSAVNQLAPLSHTFRAMGARRVLIDGAAGRKSLAGAEPGACAILCVGASMDGGVSAIAAETAHTCRLFATPEAEHTGLWSALSRETARYALYTWRGNASRWRWRKTDSPGGTNCRGRSVCSGSVAVSPGPPCALWRGAEHPLCWRHRMPPISSATAPPPRPFIAAAGSCWCVKS